MGSIFSPKVSAPPPPPPAPMPISFNEEEWIQNAVDYLGLLRRLDLKRIDELCYMENHFGMKTVQEAYKRVDGENKNDNTK